jgi:type IV pilus assembly protein PilM
VNGRLSETIMLLDIGRDSTKINVLQEGIPVLVRSVSLGGNHFTEQIHKNLGVDMEHAELMKVQASAAGGLDSPEFRVPLENHVTELCEEVKRTLDFFASATSDVKIEALDRLVLSGGGASLVPLANGLSKFLKCEATFADPFRNINVPSKWKEALLPHPHIFNVALGLALRAVGDKPT